MKTRYGCAPRANSASRSRGSSRRASSSASPCSRAAARGSLNEALGEGAVGLERLEAAVQRVGGGRREPVVRAFVHQRIPIRAATPPPHCRDARTARSSRRPRGTSPTAPSNVIQVRSSILPRLSSSSPEMRASSRAAPGPQRVQELAVVVEIGRGIAVGAGEMGHAARGHQHHPLRPRAQDIAQRGAPLVAAARRGLGRQVDVHVQRHDGHRRLRHGEVQRHVERVVERRVLRIGEVESALDTLLDDGPRERLVNLHPVLVGAEGARALRAHVNGQRRHRVEEEGLDMVAGHHGEHVGPERLQAPLHARERGVDAEDEVAVLRLRPDEQLRRMSAGEGPHEHEGHTLAQIAFDRKWARA